MGSMKSTCLVCHSPTLKGKLQSGNNDAKVTITGKPADDFLSVATVITSPITVRVCEACGRIDLYATNMQDLLRVD